MTRDHGPRDWRAAARCAQVDPETFYPVDLRPGSPAVARAKRVCARCPVRAVCLADVLATENPRLRWGITGGLTPDERDAVYLASRHAPAHPAAPTRDEVA